MLLHFSVRFLRLEARYGIFKRKFDPILFAGGYLLLAVTFIIVAFFRTKVTVFSELSFIVHVNSAVYFCAFLPLAIGYETFCYYAFSKCFAKYVRKAQKEIKKIP